MSEGRTIPGLDFEVVRPPAQPAALRTDVVGVLGRTSRGPVGRPVRVTTWRAFVRIFGGVADGMQTPSAVEGAFANGAETIWVLRLAGADAGAARITWRPGSDLMPHVDYTLTATGPGDWANGMTADIRARARGRSGRPEVAIELRLGEEREYYAGLRPQGWVAALDDSRLVRVAAGPVVEPTPRRRTRSHARWADLTLRGGRSARPSGEDYARAIRALEGVAQPALLIAPDLHGDLREEQQRLALTVELIRSAARLGDRMLVFTPPAALDDPIAATEWADTLRARLAPAEQRHVAIYHGRLQVPRRDPSAGQGHRFVACVGHVAGMISRLDRDRGPHHTPADVPLRGVVDVERLVDGVEQARLHAHQINPIVILRGRGVVVRGGRTLDPTHDGRFIAHRRMIHRLLRAIRRGLAPLVFEPNSADLRLSVLRTLNTLLLETWRAGGLKGSRPDDGFSVRCDESTTSEADRDAGRLICEVGLALAVPMEFIRVRVAVGRDGTLEVQT